MAFLNLNQVSVDAFLLCTYVIFWSTFSNFVVELLVGFSIISLVALVWSRDVEDVA